MHAFECQKGTGPGASRTSRDRFVRPNRSGSASCRGRGTMVRHELRRWRNPAGGSRPRIGSHRLCVSCPMQLLAPAVAFAAAFAHRASAVRFAATLATSLLAAGLRAVPVAAVAGPTRNHLPPAQVAMKEPALKTHLPSPSRKDARTASCLNSGGILILAPTRIALSFDAGSSAVPDHGHGVAVDGDCRRQPPRLDAIRRRLPQMDRPAPHLPPGGWHPDVPRTRATGSTPRGAMSDNRHGRKRQGQHETNNGEREQSCKSAANRRNCAPFRNR